MRLTETFSRCQKRQTLKDNPIVRNYEIFSTASLTEVPSAQDQWTYPPIHGLEASWTPMPYTAPAAAAKELHKRVENLRIYVTEMSTTQNFTTTDTGPIVHLIP